MDSLATWDLRVAFPLTWWLLWPGHNDSDHAECGGVDCNTTPFQTFPVHHWGQWRFRFFGQKNLTAQRPGLPLGTNIEGTWAHALNFFTNWLFRLTREKVDFRQNFGIFLRASGPRYSYQIFTTYDPWGSPYDAVKISTLTPKIFEKLGKNFFGGGRPQGP